MCIQGNRLAGSNPIQISLCHIASTPTCIPQKLIGTYSQFLDCYRMLVLMSHYSQVAAMRDQYPGTVGCSYMSFVQSDKQEAGGTEAQQGSSGSSNPR